MRKKKLSNPVAELIWYDGDADRPTAEEKTIGELMRMQDRLRDLRRQLCEPKKNTNPRYHALSLAVSGINRAIADIEAEYLDGYLDEETEE